MAERNANSADAAGQYNAGQKNDMAKMNTQLLNTMSLANMDANNAAKSQQASEQNAILLEQIGNENKVQMAQIQADNQQLLQANTNVNSMFSDTISGMAQIMNNPELSEAEKTKGSNNLIAMFNEGLRTTAAVAKTEQAQVSDLNLGSFFAPGGAGGLGGGGGVATPYSVGSATAAVVTYDRAVASRKDTYNELTDLQNWLRGKGPITKYAVERARVVELQNQLDTQDDAIDDAYIEKVATARPVDAAAWLHSYKSRADAIDAANRSGAQTPAQTAAATAAYNRSVTQWEAQRAAKQGMQPRMLLEWIRLHPKPLPPAPPVNRGGDSTWLRKMQHLTEAGIAQQAGT